MPKFRIEKIIQAERQRVFDIVANYEGFEKLLPNYFPSIRIRSVRDNISVVEEHLKIGDKELVMTTKHITNYPETHEVFVIGGDAKGSHIIEKYEKIPNGTKIIVEADIKLKGVMRIIGLLGKQKIASEYGKIIDEFAKIVESP
ncbi:MAG TPA: SRPBCC family protein [Candidatus Nitrosotenuis sp.]|nr:SRPBCC family protein [Candidatus Nitrosotenuis sp.]